MCFLLLFVEVKQKKGERVGLNPMDQRWSLVLLAGASLQGRPPGGGILSSLRKLWDVLNTQQAQVDQDTGHP
jgi:hypothetical protein